MSNFLMCLMFVVTVGNDTTCEDKFFKLAVKDTSYLSNFIKINVVDSNQVNRSLLLPNQTMYLFLKKSKGMTYVIYQEFMVQFYKGKNRFIYSDYKELRGYITPQKDPYVERIAKNGKQSLIRHFFSNRIFKFYKYHKHLEAVISKLFDYNVLISYVDNGQIAIIFANCD